MSINMQNEGVKKRLAAAERYLENFDPDALLGYAATVMQSSPASNHASYPQIWGNYAIQLSIAYSLADIADALNPERHS